MQRKHVVPIQARGINTKNLIIETAFKSFLKNGYKKTTTAKIAKTAKIATGVVYTYFVDKNELFELWLNSLLERCDSYFYNQFKLLDYNVEISFIISNIIEKLYDVFFSSPIIEEKDSVYLENLLNKFYEKAQGVFIKCCYDANINIKYQRESTHFLLTLLLSYSKDMKNPYLALNKDVLKNKYIRAFETIFEK